MSKCHTELGGEVLEEHDLVLRPEDELHVQCVSEEPDIDQFEATSVGEFNLGYYSFPKLPSTCFCN